ncbi:hypothetical protein WJX73_002789 [Symbiochloris irregularis]|uniref:Uncharacterized protein n=1 Tax=Symbiochloris irregularis TaxID=706552 RepID=A0AAW1NRA9_9CHLO
MPSTALQLNKVRVCPSSATVGLATGLPHSVRPCQARRQPCRDVSLCSVSADTAQQWWDEDVTEEEADLDAADIEGLGELPDGLEVQGLERLQETLESEFPLSLSEDDAESPKAEQAAKQDFDRRPSASAVSRSPWEVLDFGDCVLHVFSAEERAFYNLEGFYEGAPHVDISHLLAGPRPAQSSSVAIPGIPGAAHSSAWSIKQPL